MAIQKVITDYSGETDNNLNGEANLVVKGMTGNLYFPAPLPTTIDDLKTLIVAYNDDLNAAGDRARSAVAAKNEARLNLERGMGQVADYVNTLAKGNYAWLTTTGFKISKEPQPVVLGIVENLRIMPGVNKGTIECRVKAPKGVKTYNFYITDDPVTDSSTWKRFSFSRCKYMFTGLESGKKYWIKVEAVGTRGQLTSCDAASQYAL